MSAAQTANERTRLECTVMNQTRTWWVRRSPSDVKPWAPWIRWRSLACYESSHWPLPGSGYETRSALASDDRSRPSGGRGHAVADVASNPQLLGSRGWTRARIALCIRTPSYGSRWANWFSGRLAARIRRRGRRADRRRAVAGGVRTFPFCVLYDSASHLAGDVRGRGWGRQARRAGWRRLRPSKAEYAITSAWQHNAASSGWRSAPVGYKPNGESRPDLTQVRRRDDGCTWVSRADWRHQVKLYPS